MDKITLESKYFHWFRFFQILQYWTRNIYVLKFNFLRKVQSPAGFEAMTYRFEVNAPTHCSTLLSTNFGKQKNIKIILDFMVYFYRNYVTKWRCPILLWVGCVLIKNYKKFSLLKNSNTSIIILKNV